MAYRMLADAIRDRDWSDTELMFDSVRTWALIVTDDTIG